MYKKIGVGVLLGAALLGQGCGNQWKNLNVNENQPLTAPVNISEEVNAPAADVNINAETNTNISVNAPTNVPVNTNQKATTTVKPKTTNTNTAVKTPSVQAGNDYQTAMQTYANTRIQFVDCHGTPGQMIVKSGGKVMLDNRDNKIHTIGVGSAKYTLAAYSYKIATVTAMGTQYVTCDGGGAAQLTVVP